MKKELTRDRPGTNIVDSGGRIGSAKIGIQIHLVVNVHTNLTSSAKYSRGSTFKVYYFLNQILGGGSNVGDQSKVDSHGVLTRPLPVPL